MTRSLGDTDVPGTRIAVASLDRLRALSAGLSALRARRDTADLQRFFARYEADHRQAERDQALRVPRRDAQDRLLDVRDLLGTRMPRVAVKRDADHVIVRELGWRMLERELARAFTYIRVGAPDDIVRQQKKAVKNALLAMGWDDAHAPAVRAAIDLGFWLLPVQRGPTGITIGEFDPETSAQRAWEQAQGLVERGLELCRPPLAAPTALGDAVGVSLPGATPLISTADTAAPGWIEPSWSPTFATVKVVADLRDAITGARGDVVADARRALGELFAVAQARHDALVWWVEA